MGELTFIAVVIVAFLVAWGGVSYYLKCREVNQLRKVIDEWQGSRGWQAPFGIGANSEWDTMCAEMEADATGTATGATNTGSTGITKAADE